MKLKILFGLIIIFIALGTSFIFLTPQGRSLRQGTVKKPKKVPAEVKATNINPGTAIDLGNYGSESSSPQTGQITNGQDYADLIMSIRKPINKNVEEIVKKMKYDKIYSEKEILELSTTTKKQISEQINYLSNLDLESRFSQINTAHIQSLILLKESLENLDQFYVSKDALHFQTYSLKIEQSNELIRDLQIPN